MLTQKEALSLVQERIDKVINSKKNRCLEAGCGSGSMVDLSRGTVDGIDISQHQLDLNNHLSTKILGDIEEYDLGKSVYDLIICWDVVEHLPNPASALKIFFRAIKPNGIIIIKAPLPNSIFGLCTRMSPLWFHRFYYKYVLGHKHIKILKYDKNRVPFRTIFHPGMRPGNIEALARKHNINNIKKIEYEFSTQAMLKESNILFRVLFKSAEVASRLFYRDDRLLASSYVLILTRDQLV